MAYITAIETAVPEFCHTQNDVTLFFENACEDENGKRKIRTIAARSHITTRFSVLPDFSLSPEQFTFFPKNKSLEPEPNIGQRMQLYKKEALKLCLKTISKIADVSESTSNFTHVITVSCTGLYAPGLEVEIIKELKLGPETKRSAINFMGCNAAILALNTANAICNSTAKAKVLVVCVELCTIHFQKNFSDDYILSTALFGDGCAAVVVESEPAGIGAYERLQITGFDSLLIHKGHTDMAWQISEKGFIMDLSSYVSELLGGGMKDLMADLGFDKNAINYWAIHPGGKRILDDFATALEIDKDRLSPSYAVLNKYGNMSSATVLFVLKQVIESIKKKKDDTIFSAAFGPGLSIETMQLSYV